MENNQRNEGQECEYVVTSHRSPRTTGALITGAISGFVGWIAAETYTWSKFLPFNREVAKRTRADILGRGGLGAGISESGAFNGASGAGNHIIEEAHRLSLIEEPGFGFAKRVIQFGGRGTVALVAGVAAGLAGIGAYLAFAPKREEPTLTLSKNSHTRIIVDRDGDEKEPQGKREKNWQKSVQEEKTAESRMGV